MIIYIKGSEYIYFVNFIVYQINKIRGLVCFKKTPFSRIDKDIPNGKYVIINVMNFKNLISKTIKVKQKFFRKISTK